MSFYDSHLRASGGAGAQVLLLTVPADGKIWKMTTRMTTFWIRLRNSSGRESKVSSAILTNSSRVILHPLIQKRARSLRVAVVCVFILVIFFAVAFVFLFVFFLVGLFPKNIGLRRAIRRVRVEPSWAYSAHVHMVLCARRQEQQALVAGAGAWAGNARIAQERPIPLPFDPFALRTR